MLLALTLGLALAPKAPVLILPERSPAAIHQQAFRFATKNLFEINTIPYDLKRYDRSGLLGGKPGWFIRAGGDYQEPWTRDAAINSWNAASLMEPDIARNTLFAVLEKDAQGRPIVQPDNQWWDKVVWILGAWNHYATTGDRAFLETSYGVATRLLATMRERHFDREFGLFQGPSFFNDGIAGYPAPPAPANDTGSTFVLDHPGTDKLMALSTNCLYVEGYRTAAKMARELHRDGGEASQFDGEAEALRKTIDRRFWLPTKGRYGYFIHGVGPKRGTLDESQEGTGLSFAVLFDIASRERQRSILRNTHLEPHGIVDVYPHFERYSDDHPGRHNVTVWPMIQGLWARAATKRRDAKLFDREMTTLAKLALGSKGNFYEIYDSKSGAVEGGWQSGIHFGSVPNQTWSATAYLSMVTNGVFGMRFEPSGLRFEPLVPDGWNGARLEGIRYREADLDIRIVGTGGRLVAVRLDGQIVDRLPASLSGPHSVELTVR